MIKPRDFIETKEGLLFAVTDEKTAFLRYFKSPDGDRVRHKIRYKKVDSTDASFEYLEKKYPPYIYEKEGRRLQHCPENRISKIHSPIEKLKSLRHSKGKLIKRCLKLDQVLGRIPPENKGVTGSMLVDLTLPTSDIDFVIYGNRYFEDARNIIRKSDEIVPLDENEWMRYYKKRFSRGGELDFQTFLWHEQRKHNISRVDGTLFNLLLVGDRIWVPETTVIEQVTINCKVLDAHQSFNVPAVYTIDHELVGRVLSYTHTYAGHAKEGEEIEVSGMLEKTNEGEFIVVVGTSREAKGEFIRVVKRRET